MIEQTEHRTLVPLGQVAVMSDVMPLPAVWFGTTMEVRCRRATERAHSIDTAPFMGMSTLPDSGR